MYKIPPKKKFGQNFLIDQLALEKIIFTAGNLENKSVLEIGKEDLVKRTDLEEETVDEIVKILRSEFEK